MTKKMLTAKMLHTGVAMGKSYLGSEVRNTLTGTNPVSRVGSTTKAYEENTSRKPTETIANNPRGNLSQIDSWLNNAQIRHTPTRCLMKYFILYVGGAERLSNNDFPEGVILRDFIVIAQAEEVETAVTQDLCNKCYCTKHPDTDR